MSDIYMYRIIMIFIMILRAWLFCLYMYIVCTVVNDSCQIQLTYELLVQTQTNFGQHKHIQENSKDYEAVVIVI